jgi:hypothetical protein
MIRMCTVEAAGEPPSVTWLFHSGLSAEQRGVPAGGDHEQEAADEDRRAGQDLQPQPGRVIGPGFVGRVGVVKIGSDEGDECAPQPEQDQQESAECPSTAPHLQHPSHAYHIPDELTIFGCAT